MQLRQPKNVVEVAQVFFAVSSYNYYILQTGYYIELKMSQEINYSGPLIL